MVSSTFKDLREHRAAITDALLRQELYPIAMEYDSAVPDRDLIDESSAKVDKADAYVLLIGNRYGQIPTCKTRNPEGLSLTELEFQRAEERGIPICTFIMAPDHLVLADDVETDPSKKTKLAALRELARRGRIYAEFSSVPELRAKAIQSFGVLRERLDQQCLGRQVSPTAYQPPRRRTSRDRGSPTPQAPALFAMPPFSGGHKFVGRTAEMLLLDQWATSSDPVALFEAIGGMGKSMLIWHWICHHARGVRSDLAGLFWYSFYERGADTRDFCAHALAYATGQPLAQLLQYRTTALTPMLLEVLRQRPWLIVLDGVERILIPYHRFDAAQLPDDQVEGGPFPSRGLGEKCIKPADEALLQSLCVARPSKLLMSSRLMPRSLLNRSQVTRPGVRHVKLSGLHPNDAESMLREIGIRGSSSRIRMYLDTHFGCHPLVVGVVAGLVANYRLDPGNFDRWADDPEAGREPNLARMDLVQKRNHILGAAFNTLSCDGRTIIGRLALIADAVDYQTVDCLSPYHVEPPAEIPKPRTPAEIERALIEQLARADDDRTRRKLRNVIANRRKRENDYKHETAKYEHYLENLAHWKQVRAESVLRTDGVLIDLEARGLLQWNRSQNTYDLHPVVRGYAMSSLSVVDRRTAGEKVIDYFSSRSDPPYERARTIHDLRNSLQVMRTLIQLGEYERAVRQLKGPLTSSMFWNLEAFHEYLAILRAMYPSPWLTRPSETWGWDSLDLACVFDVALYSTGHISEASLANQWAMDVAIEHENPYELLTVLRNAYCNFAVANRIYNAKQVVDLVAALTCVLEQHAWTGGLDARALLHFLELRYCVLVGDHSGAETAWIDFSRQPRPRCRDMYRAGSAEVYLAQSHCWQGRLEDAELAAAMQLAQQTDNRSAIRDLHQIKGEYMLMRRRTDEAAACFRQAIEMGREIGAPQPALEARLALAEAQLGLSNCAREAVDRLSELDEPPRAELAEVYLVLGDRPAAVMHAVEGFKWSWADGEPYVNWWPLRQCQRILAESGVTPPELPPFDDGRFKPLAREAAVRAVVDSFMQQRRQELVD